MSDREDFEKVYEREGRLRFEKANGPVSAEDPILQWADEERDSLDLILRPYQDRHVRITIELLKGQRDAEREGPKTVRNTFNPRSR